MFLYYIILNINNTTIHHSGADIVGINCHFDPETCLLGIRRMKAGLDAAKLSPYLMVQPLAYKTPDCNAQGFIDLPEFPFGL